MFWNKDQLLVIRNDQKALLLKEKFLRKACSNGVSDKMALIPSSVRLDEVLIKLNFLAFDRIDLIIFACYAALYEGHTSPLWRTEWWKFSRALIIANWQTSIFLLRSTLRTNIKRLLKWWEWDRERRALDTREHPNIIMWSCPKQLKIMMADDSRAKNCIDIPEAYSCYQLPRTQKWHLEYSLQSVKCFDTNVGHRGDNSVAHYLHHLLS